MNYIVSYPRSGQNITNAILRRYSIEANISYKYCEFYDTCRSIPCSCKSKCNFQKNHDFYLNMQIDTTDKYLVLLRRNPIEQIDAYYRFIEKEEGHNNLPKLKAFFKDKYRYYLNFKNKWCSIQDNIRVVFYEDLLVDPLGVYSDIISFFYTNVDKLILAKVLEDIKVEKKHTISCLTYNAIKKFISSDQNLSYI